MTGWKRSLAAVAVGATVLGSGIGLGGTVFASRSAGAQGSSPGAAQTASATAPGTAPGTAPAQPGPLFGVVHGDLSLRRYDGSTLALEYDRGVIVARQGDTLTVARMDGQQVTIQLTPTTIVREGLRLSTNLFGASFYTLTGFHGTHVTIGVIWLITLWILAFRGKIPPSKSLNLEMAALYWHFVDVVWVIIFPVVYLIK